MFVNNNQRIRITHTVPNIQLYEKFQSVAVLSVCFCHSTELNVYSIQFILDINKV